MADPAVDVYQEYNRRSPAVLGGYNKSERDHCRPGYCTLADEKYHGAESDRQDALVVTRFRLGYHVVADIAKPECQQFIYLFPVLGCTCEKLLHHQFAQSFDGGGSGAGIQFQVSVFDMGLYGIHRNKKYFGDLMVCFAIVNMLQHGELPFCEGRK